MVEGGSMVQVNESGLCDRNAIVPNGQMAEIWMCMVMIIETLML